MGRDFLLTLKDEQISGDELFLNGWAISQTFRPVLPEFGYRYTADRTSYKTFRLKGGQLFFRGSHVLPLVRTRHKIRYKRRQFS